MIFTPLVKNKLASLLALPQSTGNCRGGEGEKERKHAESLLFPKS